MSFARRLPPEARRISAALAWQVGQKRLAVLSPDSPLARDPARQAARFLDRCLRDLAREEARSRLRLGRLLAEFGRRGAMTKLGFVRMSNYSRERLGISGSDAEVTARVARRLEELPVLREAFLAGALSWTKVRILSAVAREDTEARWLELAATRTVRELEELVAAESTTAAADVTAAREDDDVEVDGEPRARFRIQAPAWAWLLFRRVVELAQKMAGEGGMPVWKSAEAICAEGLGAGREAFVDDVDVEMMWLASRRGATRRGPSWKPRVVVEAPEVDLVALLPEVARWLGVAEEALRKLLPEPADDDLEDGTTPVALDRRLRSAAASIRTIDVRMGRALRHVSERRLYRELGFYDFEDYVTERLGIGLRKARSLVALDRVAAETPALGAAYDDGRVSWVRAVTLLPILRDGQGNEAAWVERAQRVMVRRLADEVSWALERKVSEGLPVVSPPPLDARLEPVQMRVNGEETVADQTIEFWGPASVVAMLERLTIAWSEPGEPRWRGLVRLLATVARQWTAEARENGIPWKERRILERDGYRCIVPGCSSRRNLQVHHIIFRSAGGGDEDWNRGALCAGHHHQCVHRFNIVASGRAPDAIEWVFGAIGIDAPLMRLSGEVYR